MNLLTALKKYIQTHIISKCITFRKLFFATWRRTSKESRQEKDFIHSNISGNNTFGN